jgi:hypothetical protein
VNAGSQFRAQQAGIGSLKRQSSHSRHPYVDGPRREASFLKVNSVPQDHSFVKSQSRLRTVPSDKLIDCMPNQ